MSSKSIKSSNDVSENTSNDSAKSNKAKSDNIKIDTESYWGALAKLPQIDAIFRACEALEAEEEAVNRESVKKLSGVTFNNLLATGIKLFRQQQETTKEFTHTPAVLLHLIGQTLDKSFISATQEFEEKLQAIEAHYLDIVESASQDLDQLQKDIEQQDIKLLEKEALLNQLVEEKAELLDQIDTEKKRYVGLESKYNNALVEQRDLSQQVVDEKNRRKEQGDDHRLAMESLKEEHNAHIQILTEQHDKANDHVMTQLGNERSQWKTELKRLEKVQAEYKTEMTARQKVIDNHVVQVIQLNQQLQTKKDIEDKLEAANLQNKQLNEQLLTLQNVQQENISLNAKLTQLNTELLAKSSLVEQLPGVEQFKMIQQQLDSLHSQMKRESESTES